MKCGGWKNLSTAEGFFFFCRFSSEGWICANPPLLRERVKEKGGKSSFWAGKSSILARKYG
jgi:hypothetical protein